MKKMKIVLTVVVLAGFVTFHDRMGAAAAETPADPRDERIHELERKMERLAEELQQLKGERPAGSGERLAEIEGRMEEIEKKTLRASEERLFDPGELHLGGYGEMHANFGGGKTPYVFDIHRLVLYLGYDFIDWIKFHSEIETEHAFVSDGSGGELSIEQAHFDFLLADALNVRLGRVLTPLGIINKKHEPPTFNGVERPLFDKYVIPTTWPSDGVGIFGSLTPSVKYEAYVVGGLDGSKFNATDGIREGRIMERSSLHEPAFTGRLDYHPFAKRPVPFNQTLRLGVSTYLGGLDNGNKGKNPGIDGDIQIHSGDVEYSIWKFNLRGAAAYAMIDGARNIGSGTASDIFGWNLEGAYHFWPDSWKKGKLERSDAVAFVRYDDVNTQFRMPRGIASDPKGDRREWTMGLGFYLTPNVVLKADYQIRDDASSQSLPDLFNLGIGFQF